MAKKGQIIDASFVEVPSNETTKRKDQINGYYTRSALLKMMLLSLRKTEMHAGSKKITKAITAIKTISASITNIS